MHSFFNFVNLHTALFSVIFIVKIIKQPLYFLTDTKYKKGLYANLFTEIIILLSTFKTLFRTMSLNCFNLAIVTFKIITELWK